MTDTPTLKEKKDCPMANSTVSALICERSGFKKNSIPSIEPGSVTERTIKRRKMMKRAGIINLLAFSIPLLTPFATTTIVMMIKRNWLARTR